MPKRTHDGLWVGKLSGPANALVRRRSTGQVPPPLGARGHRVHRAPAARSKAIRLTTSLSFHDRSRSINNNVAVLAVNFLSIKLAGRFAYADSRPVLGMAATGARASLSPQRPS